MKKTLIAAIAIVSVSLTNAQQKEGKVIYQRTMQMQIKFAGMNEEMERMIPKTRTEKFELSFGNNQSLWKTAPPDNEDENAFSDGNGMQIQMVTVGSNDVAYTNIETARRVELRELFDKKFIIDDSIRALKWKMTGETKPVLNHNCMKATATQISQRMQMVLNNGNVERKEVSDTSSIIAWFATDIPVSSGPADYQGQLPGLILEMDINNGRQVYKAIELSPKVDLSSIKEPTGKKHLTQAEFQKEREKMMAEMQKNSPGRRGVIRMQ